MELHQPDRSRTQRVNAILFHDLLLYYIILLYFPNYLCYINDIYCSQKQLPENIARAHYDN